MGSLGDELSLGSTRPTSMPTTIYGFPTKIMNVNKLEEEKMKIQGSDLDLPLCLQILNDAISYLKEEKKRCLELNTQPLLKDFISGEEVVKEKKLQLWRENDHISDGRFSDTNNKLDIERNDDKSLNGLSMLLKTPEVETGLGLGLASSSIVNGGGRRKGIASSGLTSNSVPQPPQFLQQQALLRKQRRCWTPELHRSFVDALQQLGGPGVATPKQIREHMQEEGLTNDEVKSHLQKYRLHIRKSNSNPEKQSVVVLGFNLWNSSSQEEEEEEESGEGGESSKRRSNSQSDSPQGPLHLTCTTTTTTGGDSSMEDAEDAKSESFQIWRD